MVLRTRLRVIAAGGSLIFATGCATDMHSAQSICEASGGTYTQGTCQPGSPRTARQICERMEARWVEALGMCEFTGRGK